MSFAIPFCLNNAERILCGNTMNIEILSFFAILVVIIQQFRRQKTRLILVASQTLTCNGSIIVLTN